MVKAAFLIYSRLWFVLIRLPDISSTGMQDFASRKNNIGVRTFLAKRVYVRGNILNVLHVS